MVHVVNMEICFNILPPEDATNKAHGGIHVVAILLLISSPTIDGFRKIHFKRSIIIIVEVKKYVVGAPSRRVFTSRFERK